MKAKFQPEHFPVGTVFEVNKFARGLSINGQQSIFEVKSVRRIPGTQYIVETTSQHKIGDELRPTVFNLLLIERIIRRGKGPLVIDHGFGAEQAEQLYCEHQASQVKHGPFGCPGAPSSRTHYNFAYVEFLLRHLMAKYLVEGHWCLDFERLGEALMAQSFVQRRQVRAGRPGGYYEYHVASAPKKRVDAWFRANSNRFLSSLKQERREYELGMYELSERAFGHVTRELELSLDEGSHYSEYDREDSWRRDEHARRDAQDTLSDIFE